jgi:hypothetical protein
MLGSEKSKLSCKVVNFLNICDGLLLIQFADHLTNKINTILTFVKMSSALDPVTSWARR